MKYPLLSVCICPTLRFFFSSFLSFLLWFRSPSTLPNGPNVLPTPIWLVNPSILAHSWTRCGDYDKLLLLAFVFAAGILFIFSFFAFSLSLFSSFISVPLFCSHWHSSHLRANREWKVAVMRLTVVASGSWVQSNTSIQACLPLPAFFVADNAHISTVHQCPFACSDIRCYRLFFWPQCRRQPDRCLLYLLYTHQPPSPSHFAGNRTNMYVCVGKYQQ